MAKNGSSDESLIRWEAGAIEDLDWSPDGQTLLVAATDPETDRNMQLWAVRVDDGSTDLWLAVDGDVGDARFSPDGNWIAYSSDETGVPEVYVVSFPEAGRPMRVSTAGGSTPAWRADGRELFYLELTGALMAVDVDGTDSLEFSRTRELFHVTDGNPSGERTRYDVTPDGQRFLVSPRVPRSLRLVQQWPLLLRE